MSTVRHQFKITAVVGRYPSERASWYLVEITGTVAKEIYQNFGKKHRGFGSLPVEVTVGATTWTTSIFRAKPTSSYLLFLKAGVRKRERIEVGDRLSVSLKIT